MRGAGVDFGSLLCQSQSVPLPVPYSACPPPTPHPPPTVISAVREKSEQSMTSSFCLPLSLHTRAMPSGVHPICPATPRTMIGSPSAQRDWKMLQEGGRAGGRRGGGGRGTGRR